MLVGLTHTAGGGGEHGEESGEGKSRVHRLGVRFSVSVLRERLEFRACALAGVGVRGWAWARACDWVGGWVGSFEGGCVRACGCTP